MSLHISIVPKIHPTTLPTVTIRRVRRWGDPIFVKYGFDVNNLTTTNFQAVGLYNKSTNQMGGVANYLLFPQIDVMRLAALQVEDNYLDKQTGWSTKYKMEAWRAQKMNWLCKPKGTIYFWHHKFPNDTQDWFTLPYIEWGTIALGNNLVAVEGYETLTVKTPDNQTAPRKMARLAGFTPADWSRPLPELLAAGLVHRCYCVDRNNNVVDSPKGIVYSPFLSPQHWTFIGNQPQPSALYIPEEWLL